MKIKKVIKILKKLDQSVYKLNKVEIKSNGIIFLTTKNIITEYKSIKKFRKHVKQLLKGR